MLKNIWSKTNQNLPSAVHSDRRHWWVVGFVVGMTVGLWGLAQFFVHHPPDLWPWIAPSQILGLVTAALMSLALVAGARSHMLESLFGGLDNAIRLHRRVGLTALILAVIHILLLVPAWIGRGISLGDLFIPFYSPQTRTPDILMTYGFVVLGFIAYNRRLRYDYWQWIHRANGLLFAIFAVRILIVPGTITEFEPLRTWMVFLGIAGVLAFLYRVFLFRHFGPRYPHSLVTVDERGKDAFDLVLKPTDQRMIYAPGSFAWISVPESNTMPAEMHPFTISSSPVSRDLRFSIRAVGDYTKALPALPVGSRVDVYGPFGGFSPHTFTGYRRLVLIGAGIGITPFLSMLQFELTNNDFRRIWLYYVVRDKEDAGYDDEIRASYLNADSYIDYELWVTQEQGRITASAIAEAIAPIDDYAVMLCGTIPFTNSMGQQFRELGVPAERIIAEELAFR